ncbi:MAG: hypothetical protein ISR99_00435 [Parcubacteria group bacterium]|nr:hypothetical protein [Parcubacteria group bacterium]
MPTSSAGLEVATAKVPFAEKFPVTVEDALDRKPESNVTNPDIAAVEDAEKAPSTFKFAVKVEEALAM